MTHRITQKRLLTRAGLVQSILEEILDKGTKIDLNYLEGTYTVFLKDGKGGMGKIALVQTTACCFQVFRALYEILWMIQDAQKSKRQRRKVEA